MPPHRDVVEDGQQLAGEDVHQCRENQDDGEDHEDALNGVARSPRLTQSRHREVEEGRSPVGHRGHDGDEAREVEPAGVVAGFDAAQLARPPVDATGGGVGRHELGHAQADDEDEDGDERPAQRDGDGAAVVPAEVERGEAARQNRDDRERDGEVGEPGPRPAQLLLVAEFRKLLLVGIVGVLNCHSDLHRGALRVIMTASAETSGASVALSGECVTCDTRSETQSTPTSLRPESVSAPRRPPVADQSPARRTPGRPARTSPCPMTSSRTPAG